MIMKRKTAELGYISKTILHTDPRNRDLTELYKQIETKGVAQAWSEYVAQDLDDLIKTEGMAFVFNCLSKESQLALIDYANSIDS